MISIHPKRSVFVHSIHLLYFISNIWIYLFNSQELITQLCDFNRSHQVNSVERTPKSKKRNFFMITKPQSEAVAKATINQFKSPIWNRYHYSLFTASQSYHIFHTNKDNPSMLLWKRYPAGSTFSTEATRYVYCLTPVLYICK
jgi:hypothetical protein